MFSVPQLPYAYNAVEPYIDEATMKLHHDKHHQAYVDKLNAALESQPELAAKSVEDLLRDFESLPEAVKTPVRNHAGGHANHSLFWTVLGPQSETTPTGSVATALTEAFENFESFKQKFEAAAVGQFGSGWAWLVVTPEKKLAVYALPNQDSPLMKGDTPILGLDVWEHAYYLKYQNRRPEYIAAFWNVVNWTEVERRYVAAIA